MASAWRSAFASRSRGSRLSRRYSDLRRWTGSLVQDEPAYSTWRKLTRRYEGCAKRSLASRCN